MPKSPHFLTQPGKLTALLPWTAFLFSIRWKTNSRPCFCSSIHSQTEPACGLHLTRLARLSSSHPSLLDPSQLRASFPTTFHTNQPTRCLLPLLNPPYRNESFPSSWSPPFSIDLRHAMEAPLLQHQKTSMEKQTGKQIAKHDRARTSRRLLGMFCTWYQLGAKGKSWSELQLLLMACPHWDGTGELLGAGWRAAGHGGLQLWPAHFPHALACSPASPPCLVLLPSSLLTAKKKVTASLSIPSFPTHVPFVPSQNKTPTERSHQLEFNFRLQGVSGANLQGAYSENRPPL